KSHYYRIYIDDVIQEGKAIDDVWDIPIINTSAKERLGYPTQKPEALLERIIKASSREGDVVLDAFCGCGTTCIVAQKLKRHWIGIDISPTAIKVMEKRFKTIGCRKDQDYIVIGEPKTIKELRNLKPFEFQNWAINEMQANHSRKKVGDMGLDGYINKSLFREASGIQVKQSDGVGRNVVDNFKSALERAKYKKGYLIALGFSKGAVEESARLRNAKHVDIELVTVEDLLCKQKTLK
ncbi:MAG TPA: DNA methyltransferase, partial [Thermodesulfobacteriota bacterium]